MAKVKYHFNPKKLTFEKYKPNLKERLHSVFGVLSISLLLSFGLVFILFFFFDSPKERQLNREVKQYRMQFRVFNQRLQKISQVVDKLEKRDKKIYRVIFEADPIPQSIRDAGYGGIEHYKNLEGYQNSGILINTAQKLDKLTKELHVLSNSYEEISQLASRKTEMLAAIPAIQPMKNEGLTRLASGYGYRVHPIYKTVKFHEGIDFSAPRGTKVFATGDGVAEVVEYSRRGYGNHIVVNHGYGYKTMYCHLRDFFVKQGDTVSRGELVGNVGNTGLSTAPHLHYEVLKNNQKLNPINFFHNDLNPEEYEKVLELANRANQSFD